MRTSQLIPPLVSTAKAILSIVAASKSGLCKKLRGEFYLYLSRDKTCHKQYTIYMLPKQSWGKTPNEGSPHPPDFFLGGRARQTSS